MYRIKIFKSIHAIFDKTSKFLEVMLRYNKEPQNKRFTCRDNLRL